MRVKVFYVDGTTQEDRIERWPFMRSDGVNEVALLMENGTCAKFSGSSIYWLYWEQGNVVMGGASVHYSKNPITEIVTDQNEQQTERQRDFFPDMKHECVKLGWWWQ